MAATRIINVHEAKTHLSRLLEDAHAGAEITIAKAGKPYARLVPLERPPKRVLGFVGASVGDSALAPLSEEELADWYSGPIFPVESKPVKGKRRR